MDMMKYIKPFFYLLTKRIIKIGDVRIGAHTRMDNLVILRAHSSTIIKIGKFCSIASGVKIYTTAHNYELVTSSYEPWNMTGKKIPPICKNVNIGNDVWIGSNAVIFPGVTIGDGAVIGAGAVVKSDIPPFAIAAGVPAKVIKYRFNNEIVQKLLRIKWWNWSEINIKKNIDLFHDVNMFTSLYDKN